MKVKDYLQEYRRLKHETERLKESIDEIMAMAEHAIAHYGLEPAGSHAGNSSKQEQAVAKAEWYVMELQDRMKDRMKLATEICEFISKLDDPESRHILTLRYIRCEKWPDIADEMHMTERNAFRVHGKALKEAQEIFDTMCQ